MEVTVLKILEDGENLLLKLKPNYNRHMLTARLSSWFVTLLTVFPYLIMALVYCVIEEYYLLSLLAVLVGLGISVLNSTTPFAKKQYKNAEYFFTDKRMIIQYGFNARSYTSVEYSKINNMDVLVGYLDRRFGTGSITLRGPAHILATLRHIDNPYDNFKAIKKLSSDNLAGD